jgi:hypothetical protein
MARNDLDASDAAKPERRYRRRMRVPFLEQLVSKLALSLGDPTRRRGDTLRSACRQGDQQCGEDPDSAGLYLFGMRQDRR